MCMGRMASPLFPLPTVGTLGLCGLVSGACEEIAPPRECRVWSDAAVPLVVASDGRVDEAMAPTAGVCVVDLAAHVR